MSLDPAKHTPLYVQAIVTFVHSGNVSRQSKIPTKHHIKAHSSYVIHMLSVIVDVTLVYIFNLA